mmetsp:Transcript_12476/g.35041  ORF Transcript_12476/g.35041 Transcript_12476/m.35041 type:complete len:267 (+) Transcript_12476:110-910(+)|eukprot:CAMPEP_0117668136 /NCGR_PEP_ID=MMETSP0804-20121206/11366_1 /TAXON_ID=1074897 /ORGANISM="Tetraselmis astigmatica, Strain CCMP880" /LENGTH=266 /DNA_ID=CAMNT_0005475963 /DNA_START=71 /DNA_END=871 /DNA_ORIENTATION=+
MPAMASHVVGRSVLRGCPASGIARLPVVRVAARPMRVGRKALCVRAAAASGAGSDPYEVMGLKPNATSEQIQRAYNTLTRENKGNDEALSKIEAAHSSIMMLQLTSRMKGSVQVDKDIRFADRAVFLPWRPRLFVDEKKALLRNLIVAAVLTVWVFLFAETSFTQPLLASTGLAMIGHYVKQCSINPTGGRYATPEEKKNVSKNLIRAFGLAMCGMFSGMFLFFTAPDLISAQLGKTMPYWFYESQNLLLNMGGVIMNTIFVSFFR